jgi:ABC-2 type transport system permease protein
MNAIIRLVIRDLLTFNRSLLIVQLVLPLFLLFVVGVAFNSLVQPFTLYNRTINYQQFLAVGLIGLTAMNGSLLSGTLLWTDRRHAMYEQILVGPFTKVEYATSKILSSTYLGLIGAVIIFALSLSFVGGVKLSISGLIITAVAVILDSLFFGSIAFIIASSVNSLELFEGLFNLLLVFLTFVSSLLYPLNMIPYLLRYLVLLNPLTYSIDMTRYGLLGLSSSDLTAEGLVLLVETAIAMLLAFHAINRRPSE